MKSKHLFAGGRWGLVLLFALFCGLLSRPLQAAQSPFHPSAAPLVACDPYFSIWSPGGVLNAANTIHWTGKPHRLTGMVRIDGKGFRVMGAEPASVPALPQTQLEVLPTRTIYTFEGQGARLTMTFMTPALPDDIDILSRPVTYLTWRAQTMDGKEHNVDLYLDASPEIAVNDRGQSVKTEYPKIEGLEVLAVGSVEQPVLQKRGDDLRIDWGQFYIAAMDFDGKHERQVALFWGDEAGLYPESWATDGTITTKMAPGVCLGTNGFSANESPYLPGSRPTFSSNDMPLRLAFCFRNVKVGSTPVSRWLMLAYDDGYSIQYMKKNLRPYWRRNGWEADDLLKAAARDYESLQKRCEAFDAELMADLRKAGGEKYARLGALAYRQCFAAGKFVADANGQPLQFCKENHSNGCIGTSDVFYPMAPQFLLFGPTLAKSFLVPFMNYAASERWKFPFAPHDLGTYPHANGQIYGGGERTENDQMPVEESGNLLILMAAIAQMEGNADFAGQYWKQLEQWADYLKAKGFDPENQLCTDDFAGHMAHNVNLSVKAICGLGSFAKLCAMRGDQAKAAEFFKLAHEFAQRWVKEADDGEKYRLAFDSPGTWSQKYNLVWDRILGLNLFPAEVARKEMKYYRKMQNRYGLPLDNRKDYTKLDWITWTATLTQKRADFEALIDPIDRFINETPDRLPMTDWYETRNAAKCAFTARPVVGGVFLQMLYNKATWRKWAGRDKTKADGWAPAPPLPQINVVVPAADKEAALWRYTTAKPADNWSRPGFDDSAWQEGKSGFGTEGTPGAIIGTTWNTPDIWLRREVEIPADKLASLELWIHHDDDAQVFINGQNAANPKGYATAYYHRPPNPTGQAALKPGKNLIAIHCHQFGGGQYIDLGLVEVTPAK